MHRIYSYIIISAYCMFSFLYIPVSTETVSGLLLAVILLCFSIYFDNKIITATLFSCYAVAGLFFPMFYFFIPIFLGEPVRMRQYLPVLPVVFGIAIHFLPLGVLQNEYNFTVQHASDFGAFAGNANYTLIPFFFILLGCIISLFLDWQYRRIVFLELQYKKTQDDSSELNFILQDRNRLLVEKRDYEVHTAILQERNRIAREIHDHVGHMLSRCILLTGMVKTINNDEKCAEPLRLLDDELAGTMDSVRNSVHNLHREALNLEEKLTDLVTDFTFCTAKLYYDMEPDVPPPIKYAILSITREALTNVTKHSNADLVQIRIIEHPAIYQLIISDNGSKKSADISFENGIGLQNIRDRVDSLDGLLKISHGNGFSIFISIPKKEK